MKKRKPPVLLITLLVVMVSIVAVYNLMQSGVISPNAQAHEDHAPPQQSTVTPATERQAMREAMQRQTRAPQGPTDPSGMPQPKGPTVLVPKREVYKQKPNESATSTQWYTPESGKAAKTGK